MKGAKRIITVFLITLFLLGFLFWGAMARLYPTLLELARADSRNLGARVIANAVSAKKGDYSYDELVSITSDAGGQITGLSVRVERVNELKGEIALLILDELLEKENDFVEIPLGNLTKNLLFTGRGIDIRIKVIKPKSVETKVITDFTEVGINQTRHTVSVLVSLKLQIIVLTKATTVEVEDVIVLADTVIVGRVPDGYTAINKASDELIGDIVDFKAE